MSKIIIYDTTLRDGSQTEGVSYTVNDKVKITHKLDELGVQYIEGTVHDVSGYAIFILAFALLYAFGKMME